VAKRDCALLASDDSTKDVRVAYTRWISVPPLENRGPCNSADSNARARLQRPCPTPTAAARLAAADLLVRQRHAGPTLQAPRKG
jgi:hypothetical protein